MTNPDLIPVPFAQDGDKNTIPLERIISDPAYRASWSEGFPPDTRIPEEVGGEAPDGLDFNGLFNALSQAVVFLQKGNAYQFDASMAPYPIGALVRSDDGLTTYQSTVAGNSNDPNSDMAGWRLYNSSDFVVDNLTSDDSTRPVSAKQARLLQNQVQSIEDIVLYSPIAWPKSTPPTGYLVMMGQAISQASYPKLFSLYGGVLPDMRAYTIRGLDYGRGIDGGRSILSAQEDAIRNITGSIIMDNDAPLTATGAFYDAGESSGFGASNDAVARKLIFDASRVVPTANENRVKSIAFLYIVKAG